MQHQSGHVTHVEEQVGTERHHRAVERDRGAALVVAGGEVAPLVELAVRRQVGLRGHPEHPPAVDHHGAVEQPVAVPQRRTDHEHRQQVGGRLDQQAEGLDHLVEHRVLQEEVLDRVAGQGQLGKDRDRGALLRAGPRLGEDALGVRRGVRERDRHRAGGHAGEPMAVGRGEVHGCESATKGRPHVTRDTGPEGPGRY